MVFVSKKRQKKGESMQQARLFNSKHVNKKVCVETVESSVELEEDGNEFTNDLKEGIGFFDRHFVTNNSNRKCTEEGLNWNDMGSCGECSDGEVDSFGFQGNLEEDALDAACSYGGSDDDDHDDDIEDTDSNASSEMEPDEGDGYDCEPTQARRSGNDYSTDGESRDERENESGDHEDDDDDGSSDLDSDSGTSSEGECDVCDNCRRAGGIGNNPIVLSPAQVCNLKKRKWGVLIKKNLQDQGIVEVSLCRECNIYMVDSNSSVGWEYIWPSYIWKMMTDKAVVGNNGQNVWKFIPTTWRLWWIQEIVKLRAYRNVTVTHPRAYFRDVTEDLQRINKKVKLMKCDVIYEWDYISVNMVKCPWGGEEYLPKCGSVAFDLIFSRYLKGHVAVASGGSRKKTVLSARNDYLTEKRYLHGEKDWPVMPCIQLKPGYGPCVLTTRWLHGGTQKQYIHPALNPLNGNLPSPRGDQLSHAVIQPRIVKPVKAHKYSTSYWMHEAKASYVGINTSDHTENGNLSFQSTITGNNEVLSVAGRKDIKALLMKKLTEKKVSSRNCQQILDRAKTLQEELDSFKDCKSLAGASYMTLHDAIELEKMIKNDTTVEIEVYDSASQSTKNVCYRPKWPTSLVYVHPRDKHGATVCRVPSYQTKAPAADCRLLWFVAAMLVSLPNLWNNFALGVKTTEDWKGWALANITKNCGKEKTFVGKKNNPFLKNITTHDVMSKMCPLYRGKAFSVTELYGLIMDANIDQVEVAKQTSFPSYDLTGVNVVLLFNDYVNDGSDDADPLEDVMMDVDDNEWELRFVSDSISGNTPNSWNGDIYSRHGGDAFPSWWHQKKQEDPVRVQGDIPYEARRMWSVAAYVRVSTLKFEKVKNDYLKLIGGQVNVFCKDHDYPLIIAPLKNGVKCSCKDDHQSRCSRVIQYKCPVFGCSTGMCRSHMKHYEKAEEVYYLEGWPDPNIRNVDNLNNIFGEDDEDDNVDNLNNVFGEDDEDDDNGNGGNDDDDSKDESSVSSATAELDENRDCGQVFVEGLEESGQHAIAYSPDIVTTHSGETPKEICWNRGQRIGGHVLLNSQGTCLVRRQKQLTGSRSQQHFLHRIVATTSHGTVPLVYPEAMLMPSIFWKGELSGAVVGAMPSAFLNSKKVLGSYGFADIRSHMRARITNSSLLCSSEINYLAYAFDCIANLGLRGNDERVIMNRGMLEIQGEGGLKAMGEEESNFNSDAVDSRVVVNKLAGAIREEACTYFYTHTCNQLDHPGIRYIRRRIDKRIEEIKNDMDMEYQAKIEKIQAVRNSAAVHLARTWLEVGEVYMKYILESPEQPLGKIKRIWWRWEYQGTVGNLPHIHCLIWTDEDASNPQVNDTINNRIRCSVGDLIHLDEIDSLVSDGIVSNMDDVYNIMKKASIIQQHKCTERCRFRTGTGKEELKCKCPNYRYENPDPNYYGFRFVNANHSEEAIKLFAMLGFCDVDPDTGNVTRWDEEFVNGTNVYPASGGEHFIPANGKLFAITQSQDNLQRCSRYMSARYLAKYVQGIDKNNVVHIAAGTGTDHITLEYEFLHNTKITTSSINNKKRMDQRNDKYYPKGRNISTMEMIALSLSYHQVHTNIDFVSISTRPLEERAGIECEKPVNRLSRATGQLYATTADLRHTGVIHGHDIREALGFPSNRMFTESQLTVIRDQMFSPVSIDVTTKFSVRPPELRFVSKQSDYLSWFTFLKPPAKYEEAKQLTEKGICLNYKKCLWIDGLNYQLLVKPPAIFILARLPLSTGIHQRIKEIFVQMEYLMNPNRILSDNQKSILRDLMDRFVDSEYRKPFLPIPIFSGIRPSVSAKFLIHVVLSMGRFVTELDLFTGSSIRGVFQRAGLVENENTVERDIKQLAKKYIKEQLLFLPGGTKTFDRHCVTVYNCLREAIVNDALLNDTLPPATYTAIQEKYNNDMESIRKSNKENILRAVLPTMSHHNDIPSEQELINASKHNPFRWIPQWNRAPSQSTESYEEQQRAWKVLESSISDYQNRRRSYVRCPCIAGAPGCGKTFMMKMSVLFLISRGLNVGITAVMSERSLILGGRHIHYLFKLPVNASASINRLAELALISLYKNPKQIKYLQELDILFFDELGQASAETLAVLDIILRTVRGSQMYMGGILLISTYDPLQLKPITGHPPLTSSQIFSCYNFVKLEHSVRAGLCPVLQRINQITRIYNPSESDLQELEDLIKANCKFVNDWSSPDITNDMLRIFARRKAVQKEENRFINQLRDSGVQIITRRAKDSHTAMGSNGAYSDANNATIWSLNKQVKEPEVFNFYENVQVEMTFNRGLEFSQSQLGIICEVPTPEQVENFEEVTVMISPVGLKIMPTGHINKNILLSQGWKEVKVGCAPEHAVTVGKGMYGKRQQYGFKHHIASTIHGAMGSDIGRVVTSISRTKSLYTLWLKEQVVVLLSRTSYARDITFVGNVKDTIDALKHMLRIKSQYSEYMNHVMEVLSFVNSHPDTQQPRIIQEHKHHPFRPCDVSLPTDDNGYVYILVSTRNYRTTYIGKTLNISVRIDQHNRGQGAIQTRPIQYRPWAVLTYVAGFDKDDHLLHRFETLARSFREARGGAALAIDQVINLPHDVINYLVLQCEISEDRLRVINHDRIAS